MSCLDNQFVFFHRNRVPGAASINNAQSFVVRSVTVNDAMNHAVKRQSHAFTTTHVSGCVGSLVPSCAEFAIKKKLQMSFLAPKRRRMQDLLSC